jgi:SPP1 family predicted phage head-tail adaptor
MNLLDKAEVEAMRATAAEALDTTAVIETSAEVSDGGGGEITTWTPAGTVSCRVAPVLRGQGEEIAGDRLTDITEVVLTFPGDTEIDHNARVAVDDKTFTVLEVRERSQEITRRVKAKVVE